MNLLVLVLVLLPSLVYSDSFNFNTTPSVVIDTDTVTGNFFWVYIAKDTAAKSMPLSVTFSEQDDTTSYRMSLGAWEPSGWFVDISTADFVLEIDCKRNWRAYQALHKIGTYKYIESWRLQGIP